MKKFIVLIVVMAFSMVFAGCSTQHCIDDLYDLIQANNWDSAYDYIIDNDDSIDWDDKNIDLWINMKKIVAVELAIPLYNNEDYDGAYIIFTELGVGSDYSISILCNIQYKRAEQSFNNGNYGDAVFLTNTLIDNGYSQAEELHNQAVSAKEEADEQALQEYLDSCEEINASDVIRNPDSYSGREIKFNGYVSSVQSEQAVVEINGYKFDVHFVGARGNVTKLLVGDGVTVYGTVRGQSDTYSSMAEVKASIIYCWTN